ncbi:MAG: hypothetical protein QXH92_05145 [Candidatus Aenigmatarchaeota archaeon]
MIVSIESINNQKQEIFASKIIIFDNFKNPILIAYIPSLINADGREQIRISWLGQPDFETLLAKHNISTSKPEIVDLTEIYRNFNNDLINKYLSEIKPIVTVDSINTNNVTNNESNSRTNTS